MAKPDLFEHFAGVRPSVHVPTELIIHRRKQPEMPVQVPLHDYVDRRPLPPGWDIGHDGQPRHRDQGGELPRRDLEL